MNEPITLLLAFFTGVVLACAFSIMLDFVATLMNLQLTPLQLLQVLFRF